MAIQGMTYDTVIQGDCLEMLKTMPDKSINCCVTSPPYYGLRDYGVDGQIGLEETPEAYVSKLIEVFREVRRVLKDDGTLWLNIGDSYCNSNGFARANASFQRERRNNAPANDRNLDALHFAGYKTKDLIGIPWMIAFALRDDGWYLRQDIIWHKPNPMPESVKDRCVKSHEYIFLLSKKPHYYFDYEAIQEESKWGADKRANQGRIEYDGKRVEGGVKDTKAQRSFVSITDKRNKRDVWETEEEYKNLSYNGQSNHSMHERRAEGLPDIEYEKRNKRDVWSITTQAIKEAHFATFPEKLIEPCILAGCPTEGIVLDPFFGSGTTGRVANKLNRHYIGIELNPEYIGIAQKRTDGVQMTMFGFI